MNLRRAASIAAALVLAAKVAATVAAPPQASASDSQLAIFQDNRIAFDPGGILLALRSLGAGVVRVYLPWSSLAPKPDSRTMPRGFNAGDPASYPPRKWARYDAIVRDAERDGITVDFLLSGGVPLWATSSGEPPGGPPDWKPSALQYGAFVHAVATRYSGSYTPSGASSPLPRVSFWELWNEPNFGPDLAPQASNNSTVATAPALYRRLVDYGWSALQRTGHGADTIVIGGLAPRGNSGPVSRSAPQGYPGYFSTTKPFIFLRYLYCLERSYRPLRGSAARAVGCPATAAGSRRFPALHPGLFRASGFGVHPYPFNNPPTQSFERDPNDIEFARIGQFESALRRATSAYGATRRLPLYNTEYGYITDPPITALVDRSGVIGHYVSPATAARYLNWAEYLSWRDPQMLSTMQYLLRDPSDLAVSNFATGLLFGDGRPKATYNAYRLPLFLPVNEARRGGALLVWGCVRPAHYAQQDTGAPQSVQIQFQRGFKGPFRTIAMVAVTNPRGYFTAQVRLPASGTVRLAWTYPEGDPLFPAAVQGKTIFSRQSLVTVR